MKAPLPISLLIAGSVLAANVWLDHTSAPNGILLTPVVITLATGLVAYSRKQRWPAVKTLTVTGLVALHDLGIKLFGGGQHDAEGAGFISLLLIIGLVPAFSCLLLGIRQDKHPLGATWLALALFPVLLLLHLFITSEVGMGHCINCGEFSH